MAFSRRNFLSTAPTLVAGSLLLSKQVSASSRRMPKKSEVITALTTGEPIPLAYKEIPGFLSAAQLQVHHDKHYAGAVKGYHKLDAQLAGEGSLSGVEYTTKSRARTHKANSSFMHELYFSGMAPQSTAPDEQLLSDMQSRFGSLERWWTDFQAAAASSRGWASLVYQPLLGKLYNVISDNHGNGVITMGIPILTLDMFEHAYYLDYKNNKTEYIQRFLNYMNGQNISMRYQKALNS